MLWVRDPHPGFGRARSRTVASWGVPLLDRQWTTSGRAGLLGAARRWSADVRLPQAAQESCEGRGRDLEDGTVGVLGVANRYGVVGSGDLDALRFGRAVAALSPGGGR